MKRLLPVLLVLIPLLMGAAGIPAPPSDNFMLNDIGVLTPQGRDEVARISTELYDMTGARLVFLSVASLGGMTPSLYADGIIKGWAFAESDVLFLVYPDSEGDLSLLIGENQNGRWEGMTRQVDSDGIVSPYRSLAKRLYEKRGVTPSPEVGKLLDDGFGPFDVGASIFIAALLIVMARAFRLDRKYKGKYLAGNVRRRKSYVRTYNEEDEYNNEKIYKITYDDMD